MPLPSRIRLRLCREPEPEPYDDEEGGANPAEEEETPRGIFVQEIPEIEMCATSRVGELKDRLNRVMGRALGLEKEDVEELPRLSLTTGRRVWSDVSSLRQIIQDIGGITNLRYGSLMIELAEIDIRDPPRSAEEEAELERLRHIRDMQALQARRVRRTRPKASNKSKTTIYA
mmetsp:Transcript_228/g.318  ORF Transcript_228/g.318 Transcript_228/m.318 type:complete len:173 (+) Transcript_228:91-609(+)